MVDPGYRRADIWSYGNVVGILEECPFRRHRPRRPGGANIGQSLLDADRPVRSLHDKHEIEIPIAHFADLPIFRVVAEKCANVFEASDQREQTLGIEYPIRRGCPFIRHDQLPLTTARNISAAKDEI